MSRWYCFLLMGSVVILVVWGTTGCEGRKKGRSRSSGTPPVVNREFVGLPDFGSVLLAKTVVPGDALFLGDKDHGVVEPLTAVLNKGWPQLPVTRAIERKAMCETLKSAARTLQRLSDLVMGPCFFSRVVLDNMEGVFRLVKGKTDIPRLFMIEPKPRLTEFLVSDATGKIGSKQTKGRQVAAAGTEHRTYFEVHGKVDPVAPVFDGTIYSCSKGEDGSWVLERSQQIVLNGKTRTIRVVLEENQTPFFRVSEFTAPVESQPGGRMFFWDPNGQKKMMVSWKLGDRMGRSVVDVKPMERHTLINWHNFEGGADGAVDLGVLTRIWGMGNGFSDYMIGKMGVQVRGLSSQSVFGITHQQGRGYVLKRNEDWIQQVGKAPIDLKTKLKPPQPNLTAPTRFSCAKPPKEPDEIYELYIKSDPAKAIMTQCQHFQSVENMCQ